MRVSKTSVELMRAIVDEYDALEAPEKLKGHGAFPEQSTSSAGGNVMEPPVQSDWSFFKSPQAYVIGCTLIILASAAGMYSLLSSKIEAVATSSTSRTDSVRLELKSDIQSLSLRTEARFDALMTKMDADSRELRTLILSQQRPSQQR